MGLFSKKPQGQTVVLLDVENGSVGSTLLHVAPQEKPRLFGQWRKSIPLFTTHDAGKLLAEVEKTAREALINASEVAARIRNQSPVPHLGEIARAAVMFHSPWALLHVEDGAAKSRSDEALIELFRTAVHDTHGLIPTSFHPFGPASTFGADAVLGEHAPKGALVCTITGEVCEILALSNGAIVGAATIPFGERSLLRTLKTHAGLTSAEALSALALGEPREPLAAAGAHFGREFAAAARELLRDDTEAVLVVGKDAPSVWAAHVLADDRAVASFFPQGGVVRRITPAHLGQHVAAAAGTPDLFLMLGGLFIDRKLSR